MKTFKQYLTEALMTEAVKIQPKEGISGIDKLYFSIVDGKPFFKKVVQKGVAFAHSATIERDEMEEYIDLDVDDSDIKKYVTDCLINQAQDSFDDPGVWMEWLDSDVNRAVTALKAGRSATVQAYVLPDIYLWAEKKDGKIHVTWQWGYGGPSGEPFNQFGKDKHLEFADGDELKAAFADYAKNLPAVRLGLVKADNLNDIAKKLVKTVEAGDKFMSDRVMDPILEAPHWP